MLTPGALVEALDMCIDVHHRRHAELKRRLAYLEAVFASVAKTRKEAQELRSQLDAAIP